MSANAFKFVPRKKSPAAYFNDGETIYSVQQDKNKKEPDPKLVEAVRAAWTAFNKVYLAKESA